MRMSDWSSDVCSSDLKRRGMTRVKELLREGINVAFGHDCVMDPWYPLGSHDMLEVAHMGLHVAQMTGVDEPQACFAAVTGDGSRVPLGRASCRARLCYYLYILVFVCPFKTTTT